MELICPRERVLSKVTLILGILVWLALIAGTVGIALLLLLLGFIAYLFTQSAVIAHIRGNGIELSDRQFPELYADFNACCERLKLGERPDCYILNGNGVLNAFATRFLGRHYVVLNSDVIDAMRGMPGGVRFYIGHELGHIRMKHISGHLLRWPVLWLPLLGAAYSRSRETTCDRHGRACSDSPENAARALAALATGPDAWQQLDAAAYERQAHEEPGFWMSFHEVIRGYPWLAKRFARVMDPDVTLPGRNGLAYVPALVVPFGGRLGGGFSFLIMVYIVGVMAAVAIPAYQDYKIRATLQTVVTETGSARSALGEYYERSHEIPDSLARVHVDDTLPDGTRLTLDTHRMLLTARTARGDIIFVPRAMPDGHVAWTCVNGEKLKPTQLPASCRAR